MSLFSHSMPQTAIVQKNVLTIAGVNYECKYSPSVANCLQIGKIIIIINPKWINLVIPGWHNKDEISPSKHSKLYKLYSCFNS